LEPGPAATFIYREQLIVPEVRGGGTLQADQSSVLEDRPALSFLLVRCGSRPFAVPTRVVERILRMAALTELPGAPRGVVGALNLQGAVVPVVDPRPRLGIAPVSIHPRQRLIVMFAEGRYLLWVDAVERILLVQQPDVDAVELGTAHATIPFIVRLDGLTVPVLSAEALDPGPIVRPAQRLPW
jgi:chemotaxis signal transduction protein